jgi:hypothetical protein
MGEGDEGDREEVICLQLDVGFEWGIRYLDWG